MRRLFPIFILILLFSSCSPVDRFSAGHPLTKEELISLSEELFTKAPTPQTEPETTVETEAQSNSLTPALGTVYWTDSGRTYHTDRNCRHLKNASSVHDGPIGNAWMYGKTELCSDCEKS